MSDISSSVKHSGEPTVFYITREGVRHPLLLQGRTHVPGFYAAYRTLLRDTVHLNFGDIQLQTPGEQPVRGTQPLLDAVLHEQRTRV